VDIYPIEGQFATASVLSRPQRRQIMQKYPGWVSDPECMYFVSARETAAQTMIINVCSYDT
jgi:hypothetical protein